MLRDIWRKTVPRPLRTLAHGALETITRTTPADEVLKRLAGVRPEAAQGPLIVSGLLTGSKGVSQGARLTLAGLRQAGFNPASHDIGELVAVPPAGKLALPVKDEAGAWVLCANPPEAIKVLLALDPAQMRGRLRIGYWTWELPRTPPHWAKLAQAFDAIWAPSRFVAEALITGGVKAAVKVAPHPAGLVPPVAAPDRPAFGISEGQIAILAMADLESSAARKNIVGAIEMYARAFPANGETVLIVKTQFDTAFPEFKAHAQRAARDRPDIRFISGPMKQQRAHALMASCDILFSPHRAEGFGLALAEAFLMNVPALATGWSGNLEFMAATPELLIGSRLVPAADRYGVYPRSREAWADPSADDAIDKLRTLAGSAQMRASAAEKGRAAVLALSKHWAAHADLAKSLAPYAMRAKTPM